MTTIDDICEAADKFGREDSRERSFRQRQSVGVDIAFKEANAANQRRCCYGEHCPSGVGEKVRKERVHIVTLGLSE